MNRRDFLKTGALVGAGLAVDPASVARAAMSSSTVAVATGKDRPAITRQAVELLGGMGRFVSPGKVVVVKPNIGWDRTPEQSANTHPEVVLEVVRMALAAGASKVKVFDITCNTPQRCYVNSGIAPALEAMGDKRVEVSIPDGRRFRRVPIPGAKALVDGCPFYEDALDADVFINVPVAKHHGSTRLTLGLKNMMGVMGGNRAVLHKDIHEGIVDLNRVVKSHLTVIDATRILLANGPQGGSLSDVQITDTVIASADVVAADAVACGLFGKKPSDIGYVVGAQAAGLGVADLDRIKILEKKA